MNFCHLKKEGEPHDALCKWCKFYEAYRGARKVCDWQSNSLLNENENEYLVFFYKITIFCERKDSVVCLLYYAAVYPNHLVIVPVYMPYVGCI